MWGPGAEEPGAVEPDPEPSGDDIDWRGGAPSTGRVSYEVAATYTLSDFAEHECYRAAVYWVRHWYNISLRWCSGGKEVETYGTQHRGAFAAEERRMCWPDRTGYTFAQTIEHVYNEGGDLNGATSMWRNMLRASSYAPSFSSGDDWR